MRECSQVPAATNIIDQFGDQFGEMVSAMDLAERRSLIDEVRSSRASLVKKNSSESDELVISNAHFLPMHFSQSGSFRLFRAETSNQSAQNQKHFLLSRSLLNKDGLMAVCNQIEVQHIRTDSFESI